MFCSILVDFFFKMETYHNWFEMFIKQTSINFPLRREICYTHNSDCNFICVYFKIASNFSWDFLTTNYSGLCWLPVPSFPRLSSSWTPMQSGNLHSSFSSLKTVRAPPWATVWSILVNTPLDFDKNMYSSAEAEWPAAPLRLGVWQCRLVAARFSQRAPHMACTALCSAWRVRPFLAQARSLPWASSCALAVGTRSLQSPSNCLLGLSLPYGI